MKKTTTTCIWATDTAYLLLTWVGGDYYYAQRWLQQRCEDDTLLSSEYLTKSQIRACLVPQDRYNLMVHAPVTQWLQYAINDGINPEQARSRLLEGGVL